VSTLNFNVSGDPKDDLPVIIADNPPGGTQLASHFEGVPGSPPNRFVVTVPTEITGGASLYYQNKSKWLRVIVPPGEGSWEASDPPCRPPEYAPDFEVTLQYTADAVALPPLVRHGQFYYQQDGVPVTIIEASQFRLYERFLAGQDIDPVLAQLRDEGFNLARVWLLNTSVGHILPWEHPDFYARLPEFIQRCGAFNIYVELTVFTQTKTLMPTLADQQVHYDQTVMAIGSLFAFVEGVNEADSHDNAFDPRLRLWKPPGATFDLCRGSNGADAWAVEPVIESARYHSNDTNEWWRRQAHNGMEIAAHFGVPCIANENTRPDRDGNVSHHHDAAAGAALLSAGSCLHSESGKHSVVMTGTDLLCARAFVQGAKSIDLSQREQPYIHRTDLETPSIIRAYQRGAAVVLIHS
jgi:hypothetical protein